MLLFFIFRPFKEIHSDSLSLTAFRDPAGTCEVCEDYKGRGCDRSFVIVYLDQCDSPVASLPSILNV